MQCVEQPVSRLLAIGISSAFLWMAPQLAMAQSSPYLGQLMLFGGNFCPQGWAEANGQLLSIPDFETLFQLIGTTYGGDGENNYALPDLRGRTPIHSGQGPGLDSITIGETGGAESVTLSVNNLPPHNHQVQATSQYANGRGPGGKYLARTSSVPIYHAGPADRFMPADTISETGAGQPVGIRSPYLALMWCISLEGVFPSPN